MTNEGILYRGVSVEMHRKKVGLKPKGTSFSQPIYFDQDFRFDMGLTFENSKNNAIISHQTNSCQYPTSGVSVTPFRERATYYATHNNQQRGIVYVIDFSCLSQYNIRAYRVSSFTDSPVIPEDDEYILVGDNNSLLPDAIIIDTIEV